MPPTRHRPPSPRPLLLVASGGAVGTLLRAAVGALWPSVLATLVVNVVGAFLLGLIGERLALRGPQTPRTTRTRLLVCTGGLGGFTTFSALALAVQDLGAHGRVGAALAYGLGTLAAGAVACVAGIALAGRTRSGS